MLLSTAYYTLIGSLPALPRNFDEAERAPITRLRLNERLKMLKPHDAEVIERMTDFLAWDRQPLERTDQDVVDRFDQFMESTPDPFAQQLIRQVVSVRSVIAALRCRRLKLEPPTMIEPIGERVRRNWAHPDFRLANDYPWIQEVDAQLNDPSPTALQRTILTIAWRYTKRLTEQYHFTFEAVVLYLFRWEIVYRWTLRDKDEGSRKFEALVSEAMGDYADMFPE